MIAGAELTKIHPKKFKALMRLDQMPVTRSDFNRCLNSYSTKTLTKWGILERTSA